MGEMAGRYIDHSRPAAVVLTLVSDSFARDVPIAVVRRRWPRLYPVARSLADRLKKGAGGGFVQRPRGWIYRLPRWVVIQLIGAEPEIPLDAAVDSAKDALDELVRREDVLVICGFSFHAPMPGGRGAKSRQRGVDAFTAAIDDHCRARHVRVYDRRFETRRAGLPNGRSIDMDYADLPTRTYEASLIADLVVAGLSAEQ